MAIILSNLTRVSIFCTGRFCSKFAVNRLFKIHPTIPCVCCHTTLWNLNARKQAIKDKLQGSVATYVRCGGLPISKFKKKLLLSLSVKKFKISEYLAKLKARTWLSRALCFLALMFHKVVWQHMQSLVGSLTTTLLQIYYRICQWKKTENRLGFDRIMTANLLPRFFGPRCSSRRFNPWPFRRHAVTDHSQIVYVHVPLFTKQ